MPVPNPPNAKSVHRGQFIEIFEWPQIMLDGTTQTFECCVRPDYASVIPFLSPNTILLVKVKQPGRETFWDIPGGRLDPNETAENAALRELYEETGYRAKLLLPWSTRMHTGLIRFEEHLFLATDIVRDLNAKPEKSGGEQIALVPTPWDEVIRLCLRHELRHNEVMLTLLAMEYEPGERRRLHQFLSGHA